MNEYSVPCPKTMRCILPLTVIATAAMASSVQDSVFAYRSRAEGVDTLRYIDLKGLRRTAETDAIADLVKAVFEEESEGGLGLEDEVVLVLVNDDEEEKIVADMIKQKDDEESSQPSPSTVVKSVIKAKEEKKSTKEKRAKESSKKESSKKESSKKTSPKEESKNTMDRGNTGVGGKESDAEIPSLDLPQTELKGNEPKPELAPATLPSRRPTQFQSIEPTTKSLAPQTVPLCPPHYSSSATYKAGDTIESKSNVWECQADPYEEYCSIVELNEGWNDEIKQLWRDSWVHVGACEKLVVTNQPTKVRQVHNSTILLVKYFILNRQYA
jgi:hypothetical protein